jgi:hypothetical protein
MCGNHTRLCLADPDAGTGDAAATSGVWGAWGFCQNEVPGGCVPGTTSQEDCGLCGSRTKICQNDCTYAVGSCQGQPANACTPGTMDFQVGLSCDVGGRSRFCSDGGTTQPGVAACTYGNYGGCYIPEGGTTGAELDIATTAGGTKSGTFNLPAAQTIGRLGAFDQCPNATIGTTITSYQYVEVHNPTAQTAKVSIWGSKAPAGSDIDTIMAVYNGFNVPLTDTARKACSVGVTDDCSDTTDPTSCLMSWAGLMSADGNPVTIGPFNSAIVYTAAYFAASGTITTSGPYILSVRTESLQ